MGISVRGVNVQVFREFKAEAVRDGLSVGEAVTHALRQWLESRRKRHAVKKSLLDLKPVDFGPGSEKLSRQVDEVVYGWKK